MKPYGYQASEAGATASPTDILKTAGRMTADMGSAAAEAASYAIAPMPMKGAGFTGFLKNTAAASGLTSASSVGKSIDKGDSVGDTVAKGAEAYVAATAAFGMMRFASSLWGNYGGKLLGKEANIGHANNVKQALEDSMTATPDMYKPELYDNAKLGQSHSISEALALHKEQYDTAMINTRNASIDTLLPNVENEALATHNLFRSMGENAGNNFKEVSNPLYEKVKLNTNRTEATPNTDKAIDNTIESFGYDIKNGRVLPNVAQLQEKAQAGIYYGKQQDADTSFIDFLNKANAVKKDGLTISNVLDMMENSHQYLADSTPAQSTAINEVISQMRSDVRKLLPSADIKEWDMAHSAWQKAKTLYDNPILNKAKNSGFSDAYVNAIMELKPSPERDLLIKTLQGSPQESSDLLVNTVMRRAKQMSNEDASQYIGNFLKSTKNYDGTQEIVDAEQRNMLGAFRDFSSQDFRTSAIDIQNHLGIEPEGYRNFVNGKEKLDIFHEVTSGKFDDISKNFNRMVINEPDKIGKIIGNFDDKEREVFGQMLTQDLMEKSNSILVPDPSKPGRNMIGDNFISTYENMYLAINNAQKKIGDPTLHGMFTPDEATILKKGFEDINSVRAIVNSASGKSKLLSTLSLVQGVMYAKLGYVTGAFRSVQRALTDGSVNGEIASAKDVTAILREWQQNGTITGFEPMPDIFKRLNAFYLQAPAVTAGNEVGKIETPNTN